jgi:hypothetical protein
MLALVVLTWLQTATVERGELHNADMEVLVNRSESG